MCLVSTQEGPKQDFQSFYFEIYQLGVSLVIFSFEIVFHLGSCNIGDNKKKHMGMAMDDVTSYKNVR
jgi:hypothetical protein